MRDPFGIRIAGLSYSLLDLTTEPGTVSGRFMSAALAIGSIRPAPSIIGDVTWPPVGCVDDDFMSAQPMQHGNSLARIGKASGLTSAHRRERYGAAHPGLCLDEKSAPGCNDDYRLEASSLKGTAKLIEGKDGFHAIT